jgi:RecB family endonuclease NucS
MTELDLAAPFCLYALCTVNYDGRAYSHLESGCYLIISKQDGTFLVHGSTLSNACNYQGPGSKLTLLDNVLTCTNKKEKIIVTIQAVINYWKMPGWSGNRPVVGRTEKELVQKIFSNWAAYFPGEWSLIEREHQTPLGPLDLYAESSTVRVIVEVKRKKVTVKDVTQLRKYVEQYSDAVGFLAGPTIGEKALRYLTEQKMRWLPVGFD